jgi:hypothetical protein
MYFHSRESTKLSTKRIIDILIRDIDIPDANALLLRLLCLLLLLSFLFPRFGHRVIRLGSVDFRSAH